MIDTELDNRIEETVLKTLKKYGVVPSNGGQTTLTLNDVDVGPEMEEFMQDKQCLVRLY